MYEHISEGLSEYIVINPFFTEIENTESRTECEPILLHNGKNI